MTTLGPQTRGPMRMIRSAFVVTVAAAACTRNASPSVEEPSHNPPALPPDPTRVPTMNPPPPTCPPRESIREGEPCSTTGMECYQPTGGCQPGGFRCEEHVWRGTPMPTCNPPPPPSPP